MSALYESIKSNESKNTALFFENKKISYRDFNKNIRKSMTYLKKVGIKKGDIVTLVLPNIPANVYLIYSLNAIGATINIIHPLSKLQFIFEDLKDKNSDFVFLSGTLYKSVIEKLSNESSEILTKSKDNLKIFFVNLFYDKSVAARELFSLKFGKVKKNNLIHDYDDFRKCEEISANCVDDAEENKNAIFLHSGGTSGLPKTVILSDKALNNLASKVKDILGGDDPVGKNMLAVLPCFHGFGLGMGIHAPLFCGAGCVLMIKFNAKKVIKSINKNVINYIIGVPLLYKKLLKEKSFSKAKLQNLDYCFIGGDDIDEDFIIQFNDFLKARGSDAKLLEGYGLTETVTVCSVNTKADEKTGSVGKPLKGITIEIRDDNLKILPQNAIGEIFVYGDTLMTGYYNDIGQAQETMLEINGRTSIKTGDIGYLDEDGFLFIKGRKKRLIKIGGINIFPCEIENFVMKINGVAQSALVYFEREKPHLILYIKKSDKKIEDALLKSRIALELQKKFLKYCQPSEIIILDRFPLTKIGKVDYNGFVDSSTAAKNTNKIQ